MKIIKNTDSFKLAIKRFMNTDTKRYWWLINCIWFTITTNNQGE